MANVNLHSQHQRVFAGNRFVYPVLSRRSGGISVGINLNPDRICNFDCIYCQVDRIRQSETRFVDTDNLLSELDRMIRNVVTGDIFRSEPFQDTPISLRRFTDIAFSGDGEPTTYSNFDQIVEECASLKRKHGLKHVKFVLITNASMLHRPHIQRGLEILDANQGEIWAKLDAGTEEYFKRVERTSISLQRILDNITAAAQLRPLVIQALFMRIDGQPPSRDELSAFCDRLVEIASVGGQVSLVQVYTIARRPADAFVTPLRDEEVDAIVAIVRQNTGLSVSGFYGLAQ